MSGYMSSITFVMNFSLDFVASVTCSDPDVIKTFLSNGYLGTCGPVNGGYTQAEATFLSNGHLKIHWLGGLSMGSGSARCSTQGSSADQRVSVQGACRGSTVIIGVVSTLTDYGGIATLGFMCAGEMQCWWHSLHASRELC